MIAGIELAMLARLKAASDAGALGYTFRTLETYPANWDIYLRDKVIRAPGAWVVFAGLRGGEALAIGSLMAEAQFGLVVLAENSRNETAQRHGGPVAAEPGSYQLAEDAIALLHGWCPDVDGASSLKVRALHQVRTMEIASERKISMLAIELTMPVQFQASMDAPFDGGPTLGDFATFHVDWDIPPFAQGSDAIDADPSAPGVQLPDDAHADATDTVQLETGS